MLFLTQNSGTWKQAKKGKKLQTFKKRLKTIIVM